MASTYNTKIVLKKSTVAGEEPVAADLEVAEVAVNTADGKLFTKHTDGTVRQISGVGPEVQVVRTINELEGHVDFPLSELSNALAGGRSLVYRFAGSDSSPSNGRAGYSGTHLAVSKRAYGNMDEVLNATGSSVPISGLDDVVAGDIVSVFVYKAREQTWEVLTEDTAVISVIYNTPTRLVLDLGLSSWGPDLTYNEDLIVFRTVKAANDSLKPSDKSFLRYDGDIDQWVASDDYLYTLALKDTAPATAESWSGWTQASTLYSGSPGDFFPQDTVNDFIAFNKISQDGRNWAPVFEAFIGETGSVYISTDQSSWTQLQMTFVDKYNDDYYRVGILDWSLADVGVGNVLYFSLFNPNTTPVVDLPPSEGTIYQYTNGVFQQGLPRVSTFPPLSAISYGLQGTIAQSSDDLYVAIGQNSWKKLPMLDFTSTGYVTLADFKSVVAASSDFADFQSRVAGL